MENIAEYIIGGLIGLVSLFAIILPKVVEKWSPGGSVLPPDEGDEDDLMAHAETAADVQEQLDDVAGSVESANKTVGRSERLNRLAGIANEDDS